MQLKDGFGKKLRVKLNNSKVKIIVLFILLLSLSPALTQSQGHEEKFVVALDSGHNPKGGGAVSVKGVSEIVYNDKLTKIIKEELGKIENVEVVLTRIPGETVGLRERVKLAAKAGASLLISIHHDSAQLKYLKKTIVSKKNVFTTTIPIRGFSLFVSQKNVKNIQSIKFAKYLGRELLLLGRKPTHHHAENIKGENRLLISPGLGIYSFNELVILKEATMPAVLFEVGVLVDAEDEKYINDPKNKMNIATAVKKSVVNYMKP
jgi:N-acetylmuramoyl-L-alanine amidase